MTGPSREDVYCRVALPRPVFQTFVYRVPADFVKRATPGCGFVFHSAGGGRSESFSRSSAPHRTARSRTLPRCWTTSRFSRRRFSVCVTGLPTIMPPLRLVYRAALPPDSLATRSRPEPGSSSAR